MTLRAEYPDMPIGDGCGAFIATAYADQTDSRTRGKEEANARLIAAAPDMLAVLLELQASAAYWSEYDVPLGIVDRINAAIEKAGVTPEVEE